MSNLLLWLVFIFLSFVEYNVFFISPSSCILPVISLIQLGVSSGYPQSHEWEGKVFQGLFLGRCLSLSDGDETLPRHWINSQRMNGGSNILKGSDGYTTGRKACQS